MVSFSIRKIATLVAAVCLLLVGSGCTTAPADDERPVVLTTFTVIADIAANVAGDRLQVESITKPGAEIHGYEPTPADIRRASSASLIVDNGLGLEAWFAKFVDRLDVPHVVVSKGVDPINITADADADKPNPHAWMSPVNAQIYVDNLAGAFTDLDPAGAQTFRANAEAYKKKLRALQDHVVTSLNTVPAAQRALVTCEGAFSYLTRDVGLTEKFIWPVNAEQEATPKRVADTVDFVRANRVPAVFCESTVSDKPMRQIASTTGAHFGGILYVDSLSTADGPVPTYLDMIEHDLRTIIAGLTGKQATT